MKPQPFAFPSHGTLPDRIQLSDVESPDISVCARVFDKRIISTAIIGITDIKFGQAEMPCKTAAFLSGRGRPEDIPALLIKKANSPRPECAGAAKER
jgi:hypothetical protein